MSAQTKVPERRDPHRASAFELEMPSPPLRLPLPPLPPPLPPPHPPGASAPATATRYRGQHLGGSTKRVLDLVVAAIALVLALPIMMMVALAVRIWMGGPVIFAQPRVGLDGQLFRCFKFRTMLADGDAVLKRYLDANPAAAQEWQSTCKLSHDPRVTPLGHLLRKSSLDELPQLINILRGEMSCVGPRPVVATEIEKYGANTGAYTCALPGLTGLWQCSGRSKLNYEERVALDVLYANNWSLRLDLWIMLRTIPAVLKFDQSA
jgi:exopolysaccharide production protein ExoY